MAGDSIMKLTWVTCEWDIGLNAGGNMGVYSCSIKAEQIVRKQLAAIEPDYDYDKCCKNGFINFDIVEDDCDGIQKTLDMYQRSWRSAEDQQRYFQSKYVELKKELDEQRRINVELTHQLGEGDWQ
jgi:hypothetical protein